MYPIACSVLSKHGIVSVTTRNCTFPKLNCKLRFQTEPNPKYIQLCVVWSVMEEGESTSGRLSKRNLSSSEKSISEQGVIFKNFFHYWETVEGLQLKPLTFPQKQFAQFCFDWGRVLAPLRVCAGMCCVNTSVCRYVSLQRPGVMLCYSPRYSFETGSLTEAGTRLASSKPGKSHLHSPQHWGYRHMLRYTWLSRRCSGLKLSSSCLWSKCSHSPRHLSSSEVEVSFCKIYLF